MIKTFLLSLFMAIAGVASAAQTNGVFYTDQNVVCQLLAQNGTSKTNELLAGKSYMVVNEGVIAEFSNISTNPTTYYLSNGALIQCSPSSVFSIDVFDQEVNNLDAQPRWATMGSHNISMTLTKGEFVVIYPTADSNSSATVNTPYAIYQISAGKYLFRVSEKSGVAYTGEGIMQVHGDKNKVDKTEKGKLALAVPFQDPESGVSDKIITTIKPVKQEDTERYTTPIATAEKSLGNVRFAVVGGQVVGILMK